MNPHQLIKDSLDLLPLKMRGKKAERMLLAIGYQESGFTTRVQTRGPAVGFWQFEKMGGLYGVLEHSTTKELARNWSENWTQNKEGKALDVLYEGFKTAEYDHLACLFARLLLWTHPKALPTTEDEAWRYYLDVWRPGKPHRNRWVNNWKTADSKIK